MENNDLKLFLVGQGGSSLGELTLVIENVPNLLSWKVIHENKEVIQVIIHVSFDPELNYSGNTFSQNISLGSTIKIGVENEGIVNEFSLKGKVKYEIYNQFPGASNSSCLLKGELKTVIIGQKGESEANLKIQNKGEEGVDYTKKRYINTQAEEMFVSEPIIEYQSAATKTLLNLSELFEDKMRLVQIIQSGIPYVHFDKLRKIFPFTFEEWAILLGISSKSIQRIKRNDEVFKPIQSEKIIEIAEVVKAGMAFFDSKKNLENWLKESNYALGGVAPQDLLKDSYGKQLVLDTLIRMEHGIFI